MHNNQTGEIELYWEGDNADLRAIAERLRQSVVSPVSDSLGIYSFPGYGWLDRYSISQSLRDKSTMTAVVKYEYIQ